ncbi:hypothetical protein L204_102991 [Cryptococcus depauperatus]|nr:hypothetical protein L204_00263 [Cryptococcus depauperatus CBS 7855]
MSLSNQSQQYSHTKNNDFTVQTKAEQPAPSPALQKEPRESLPSASKPSLDVSTAAVALAKMTVLNGDSSVGSSSSSLPLGKTGQEEIIRDQRLAGRKRKWSAMGFSKEEQEELQKEDALLHKALLLDQEATLYPPPPTRFQSFEDAVQRLLPYHIWQTYDDELDSWDKADVAKETEDAKDMIDRIKSLKERFARARRREDDRPSPLPSTLSFLYSSTSMLREDMNAQQTTLRNARIELNALEQEHRRKEFEQLNPRLEGGGNIASVAMRQALNKAQTQPQIQRQPQQSPRPPQVIKTSSPTASGRTSNPVKTPTGR